MLKHRLFLLFMLILLKQETFSQLSLKPVPHRAGAFISKEDFLNNNITSLGIYDSTQKIYSDKVYFFDEQHKKIKCSFKQKGYFALRDNNGEIFFRDNDVFSKIVLAGNICMFASPDSEVHRDSTGNLISVNGECWYAEGFNGIRKDFKEILRKDPEIYKAFTEDKRKAEAKTIHYIRLYNSQHPVQ